MDNEEIEYIAICSARMAVVIMKGNMNLKYKPLSMLLENIAV